ncbi:MAG: phosphate ABC transporter permease subunit PstC [Actinobacteria bacterium]|nr:MAG: phosphate ABC transporter permease subunit PstC [Actinomycetota bacterium]
MDYKAVKEFVVEKAILVCGLVSIIGVILIFFFLLREGGSFFLKVPLSEFLTGKNWYPTSTPPQFGILPLLLGSLIVTGGAVLLAVPLGVCGAIFIAEVAKGSLKEFLKSGVELIQAIPSVVLGFLGAKVLGAYVMDWFGLDTGLTAFTASLLLAFMALPTIISVMEDAVTAVPHRYRESAIAMGATRWQTIYRVVLPAAASGMAAAIMLGIGRAIGETMVVAMASGNAAIIPKSIFDPVKTLTATIATEMGEATGTHALALFAIAIVLFAITLLVNVTADFLIHRKRVK